MMVSKRRILETVILTLVVTFLTAACADQKHSPSRNTRDDPGSRATPNAGARSDTASGLAELFRVAGTQLGTLRSTREARDTSQNPRTADSDAKTPPAGTVDLQATINAAVAAAVPTTTPDLPATVQAMLAAREQPTIRATANPLLPPTPTSQRPCAASEEVDRAALVALYNAAGGTNWTDNTIWLTDTPVGSWYGVTTGFAGCLNGLILEDNGLTGPIPPELSNLADLKVLDLGGNKLTGSIPPELSNLTYLNWLSLRINEMSGEIPPELGNLTNLEVVDLAENKLTGEIPPELGNLGNLAALVLDRNRLTGQIPPSLGNLTNLDYLRLGGTNQSTGCIPQGLDNASDNYLSELGLPFC